MTYTHCSICGEEKKHNRAERCKDCGYKASSKKLEGNKCAIGNKSIKGQIKSEEWCKNQSIRQGGTGQKQKYPELKRWTRLVKERDGCCFICQTTEKLEAHHILPKAKYPEYATEVWNGIAMCKTHHIQKHSEF